MTTDLPAEKRKRVRIMDEVSDMGYVKSEYVSVKQVKLPSQTTGIVCFSARPRNYKNVPRMSEEMKNVMSSFQRLEVEASGNDSEEIQEKILTYGNGNIQTTVQLAWKSKATPSKGESGDSTTLPSLPGTSNGLNFSSTARIISTVHSATKNRKAKPKIRDITKDTNVPLTRTTSDASYSRKTKYLLNRCADVYGKISEIHDHVKVIRSRSLLSLDDTIDTDPPKRIQNKSQKYRNQSSPSLERMIYRRGIKQRSLDDRRTRAASQDEDSEATVSKNGAENFSTRQRSSTFT
ncbi:uncharacterized protein LOC135688239 [Rhopilema esculentum]|uniref:uncharacterized protein LOC135688239 n=1 Tax=Rhopilema esculentum TaxID=499914 RepID=UPI0031DA1BE6|eukprot:gene6942-12562_t